MNQEEMKEITRKLSDIDSELSMFLLENTVDDYGEIAAIDLAREHINDLIMTIDAKASEKKGNTATHCGCLSCTYERRKKVSAADGIILDEVMSRMFVCEECGNKRCPHSTDHRFACTGSNEPGQRGSRYQ